MLTNNVFEKAFFLVEDITYKCKSGEEVVSSPSMDADKAILMERSTSRRILELGGYSSPYPCVEEKGRDYLRCLEGDTT